MGFASCSKHNKSHIWNSIHCSCFSLSLLFLFVFSLRCLFVDFYFIVQKCASNRLFTIYLFFVGTIIVCTIPRRLDITWDLLFGFCFSGISFVNFFSIFTFLACTPIKLKRFTEINLQRFD